MATLLFVALFGLDFNLCDSRPVTFCVVREQCYHLCCQCKDCQGAACRCGTLAKIPAAIPVFNRPETPESSIALAGGFRQVRVCGPNGCSTQMVPTEGAWSTTSSSTGSACVSCQSATTSGSYANGNGFLPEAEHRGFRPLRLFKGGKGGGRRCRSCQ